MILRGRRAVGLVVALLLGCALLALRSRVAQAMICERIWVMDLVSSSPDANIYTETSWTSCDRDTGGEPVAGPFFWCSTGRLEAGLYGDDFWLSVDCSSVCNRRFRLIPEDEE